VHPAKSIQNAISEHTNGINRDLHYWGAQLENTVMGPGVAMPLMAGDSDSAPTLKLFDAGTLPMY
jgi:hypothetical protein